MLRVILLQKAYNPGYTYLRHGKIVRVESFSDRRVKRSVAAGKRDDRTGDLFGDAGPTIDKPLQELIEDHEKVIDALQSPLKAKRQAAADEQKKHLEKYREQLKSAESAGGPQAGSQGAKEPTKAQQTRERRQAVLDVLGEGWKAQAGVDGARDAYKKVVARPDGGKVQMLIMPEKTVDGNFYVGAYNIGGARPGAGGNGSAQTLEEAKLMVEKLAGLGQPVTTREAAAAFQSASQGAQQSGNVPDMDDADSVASKQAPNPAGDGMTGSAEPRYSARNWQEWIDLPQFQSDDESTVLFNRGRNGYITEVRRNQSAGSLFDGLFAGMHPESAEFGPDVTAFRIPNDKMLRQRDLDYELDYDTVAAALIDVFPRKIEQDESDFDEAWRAVVEDRSDFESLGLEDGAVREDSFMDILNFSEDQAGEASWFAQRLRGRLAEKLGYQAVAMDDENGISWYIVPGVKSIPLNESSAPAGFGAFRQGAAGKPMAKAFPRVLSVRQVVRMS